MTDRAALVEKMRTLFVTSEGDDWHCMGLVLDLIRAEVLEEAARAVDAEWGKFIDSDVTDILKIIRALKDA